LLIKKVRKERGGGDAVQRRIYTRLVRKKKNPPKKKKKNREPEKNRQGKKKVKGERAEDFGNIHRRRAGHPTSFGVNPAEGDCGEGAEKGGKEKRAAKEPPLCPCATFVRKKLGNGWGVQGAQKKRKGAKTLSQSSVCWGPGKRKGK